MKNTMAAIACSLIASFAVAGIGLLGEKTVHKLNAKANADIRAAQAQEMIAAALERIAR